jgi:tetraacyldisaccharide 4'-kinase
VISVGNITWGGTGKTTLVEYVVRHLLENGRKVAIISRGYKGKGLGPESIGDEPYMLSKKLPGVPLIVDPDRIKAAQEAIARHGADTVILDDGFQQWGMKKDLEIVTIDATNPFGNRQMIPRGILREPLAALARADIFVLTKTNLVSSCEKIKAELVSRNPQVLIVESEHQPVAFYEIRDTAKAFGLDALKGKAAAAFSGIGDPDSFENLLKSLGISLAATFRFSDHHLFSQAEIDSIISAAVEKKCSAIITSEKDAARLYAMPYALCPMPILALSISLVLKNSQPLHARLHKLYSV